MLKKLGVIAVTVLALLLNFIFSILLVCFPSINIGGAYLIWLLAQAWVAIFIAANSKIKIK